MREDWWREHMQDHMDGGFGGMGGMGGAGWWVGGLLMILLAVAIVAVVVALVVAGNRTADRPQVPTAAPGAQDWIPGGPRPSRDPAEALLRDRYARGDIDERDYDQRLAALRRG